jgi:branched-chain amino acid transport system substrate-binding protein
LKRRRIALVLAIALIVVFCSGCTRRNNGINSLSGKPYTIGILIAKTGHSAPADRVSLNTALFVERLINTRGGIEGHPFHVVTEDTLSTPDGAAEATRQLANRADVSAIVGPFHLAETLAAREVAEATSISLLASAEGQSFITPNDHWAFSVTPVVLDASTRIADYLVGIQKDTTRKTVLRVALLADKSEFGNEGFSMLSSLLEQNSIHPVIAEQLSPAEMTAERMTKISATQPNQVIYWGSAQTTAAFTTAIRNARCTGVILGSPSLVSGGFAEQAGASGDGVLAVTENLRVGGLLGSGNPQVLAWTEYSEQYKEQYKTMPNLHGGHTWDALQITIRALAHVGSDRTKVRDFIERMPYTGTAGSMRYSFQNHGNVEDAFSMTRLLHGQWQPL